MITTPINWNIAKAKLQQKFSVLTAHGLFSIDVGEEELLGRCPPKSDQSLKIECDRARRERSQDRAELSADPFGLEAAANAHLGKISNAIL